MAKHTTGPKLDLQAHEVYREFDVYDVQGVRVAKVYGNPVREG